MKAALRESYEREQSGAFARYLANAKLRMKPVAGAKPGEELYEYRAPGSEKPFLLRRLETGHWLIRSGYALDTDPEPWHRVKSERAREVLKLARQDVFCGRR